MLRVPWTVRRTNASILEELEITKRLSSTINRRILKYFGHLMGREGENLEKLTIQGKVPGRRDRGRYPKGYTDQIWKHTGVGLEECIRMASDREQWKRVTEEA